MEVFIPFLVLVWASLLPHLQLPSAEAFSQISHSNYETIFDYVNALPFINTAILMFAVPTATMFLSVLVSCVVVRTQVSFRRSLDTIAFLRHAIPRSVLAVRLASL